MMQLNKYSRTHPDTKLSAVKKYLVSGKTLRDIGRRLGIAHATLWHWVRRYKQHGEKGLCAALQIRRNHGIGRDVETEIMLLKERNPGLSIRKAQAMITGSDQRISTFLIWQIWHDHGLIRKKSEDQLSLFTASSPGTDDVLNEIQRHIDKKEYQKAASILNEFPGIPRTRLLRLIPEKFLSPRRRLDQLCIERREGSYVEFAKKAERIGMILEKNSLLYSSLIANFIELEALDIIGQPESKLRVLKRISVKMKTMNSYPMKFLYAFEQAYTAVYLLQINRAQRYMDRCRLLLYSLPYPQYQEMFGALLVLLGRFKNAGHFYQAAMKNSKLDDSDAGLILQIARYAQCYAGEYGTCRRMLTAVKSRKDKINSPPFRSAYSITNAFLNFGLGYLTESANFFVKSLETAFKGRHANRIYAASVGLAGVAMALNNINEARSYLKKYLPLMRKNHLRREVLLLQCFLREKTEIRAELKSTPPFRLLDLMMKAAQSKKIGDYRTSFKYARRHGISGLFHRWIVFFPESVLNLLDRGRKTGLSKAILNFPVFNQKTLVYDIKFLGKVVLYRNRRRMVIRLTPKEKAFLIHVALRADAPGKSILVDDLCKNFWPRSLISTRLLSHMTARLRKKLHIPLHLLSVSFSGSVGPRLVNNGIYFMIDYNEYVSLLTQAKTLKLSDEWRFSRREYLRAFRLFRGRPFEKMYDSWSEQMRRVVLNKVESEVLDFSRSCLEQKNKKEGRRILSKFLKLVQGSTELNEMSKKYDRLH